MRRPCFCEARQAITLACPASKGLVREGTRARPVSFTPAQALYMTGPDTIDCHAGLSSVNRPNTHRRTVICDVMRENVMHCFVSFFSLFNLFIIFKFIINIWFFFYQISSRSSGFYDLGHKFNELTLYIHIYIYIYNDFFFNF